MSKLIAKKGIYDMSMDDYHGQCCVGPSVSSTDLRTLFTLSPAHMFEQSSLNTEHEEDEDEAKEKAHFSLGRAAHHLILGEEAFSTLFVIRPETLDGAPWQGNRTVCRKWLADQANQGRTVLKGEQIKQIRGMAKALSKHPLVQHGILNGQIEKSLIWKDEETGIWLKSRPDAIPTDCASGADLKTTTETGFKLDRAIAKYRYDMQAALVKMGFKACLNIDMDEFSFIFVETKPPHSVDVVCLSPEDLAEAERDVRASLRVLRHCLDTGDWFGPMGTQRDARYVHFSKFAKEEQQFRREFLEREIAPAEIPQDTARYAQVI